MTYPTSTNYSANFTRAELDCRCGCKTPAAIMTRLTELAIHLEELRAAAGAPLIVTSGYRCIKHNKAVGGAKDSQHIQGIAADVRSLVKKPPEIYLAAESVDRFHAGGIGLYDGWVHVDYRQGGPTRWRG